MKSYALIIYWHNQEGRIIDEHMREFGSADEAKTALERAMETPETGNPHYWAIERLLPSGFWSEEARGDTAGELLENWIESA